MVLNGPQVRHPAEIVETGIQCCPVRTVRKVVRHSGLFVNGDPVVGIGRVDQCFNVNNPQTGVVMRDVETAVPTAAVALIGFIGGLKVRAVEVVRGKQEPFLCILVSFAVLTIAMVFSVGNFPISNQFWFELELPVFHHVIGRVEQVDDAGADARAQDFHSGGDQVNGLVRITNVGQIDHGGKRFGVMDVRSATAVFVAGWPAVGLAVSVQIKEIHPKTDLWCSPPAHQRITKSSAAGHRMGEVGGF